LIKEKRFNTTLVAEIQAIQSVYNEKAPSRKDGLALEEACDGLLKYFKILFKRID